MVNILHKKYVDESTQQLQNKNKSKYMLFLEIQMFSVYLHHRLPKTVSLDVILRIN